MNKNYFRNPLEAQKYVISLITDGKCIPGIYRQNKKADGIINKCDESVCACRVPDDIVAETSDGETKSIKKGGYIVFFEHKIWGFDEDEFNEEYTDVTKTDGFYDYYLENKENCLIPEEKFIEYYGIGGFAINADSEVLEDFSLDVLVILNAVFNLYTAYQEKILEKLDREIHGLIDDDQDLIDTVIAMSNSESE